MKIRDGRNRGRKKANTRFKKNNRLMRLLILSFLAIIGEITLYRKTFIDFWLAFTIFLVAGLLAWLVLRKRLESFFKEQLSLFWQGFYALMLFGGAVTFSFMALNYYIPLEKNQELRLLVVKAGSMASRKGCSGNYAIVKYAGIRKQLIFDCGVRMEANDYVNIKLNKGLFGFFTVEEMKIIPHVVRRRKMEEADLNHAYTAIIDKAEAYATRGNTPKAIELYERAVSFRPSDSLAKKRLIELRKREQ
jgi:tetratricopeptide (TPR) repeat protein